MYFSPTGIIKRNVSEQPVDRAQALRRAEGERRLEIRLQQQGVRPPSRPVPGGQRFGLNL